VTPPGLLASLLLVCAGGGIAGCGGNAQGGTVNVPSINRPWTPEDMDHDVIANGPEACGPTKERPQGSKLPQCPEQASSAKVKPSAPPSPQKAPRH
jgi:hypothetical protein